jgi:hypothetical protein
MYVCMQKATCFGEEQRERRQQAARGGLLQEEEHEQREREVGDPAAGLRARQPRRRRPAPHRARQRARAAARPAPRPHQLRHVHARPIQTTLFHSLEPPANDTPIFCGICTIAVLNLEEHYNP